MSTAALPSPTPENRRRQRSRLGWELRCGPAPAQSLELDVTRGPDGCWELAGRSAPAGSHAEVEVCAGWTRLVVALDETGAFRVTGLPGDARHFKLSLRGGPAPAVVLPGLPAESTR